MPETVTRTTRLCDLSAPLFALCFSMRGAKDPGSPEAVRIKVLNLFKEFEESARAAGYKPQAVQDAKYAVTAYVDELVLGSNWTLKDAWSGNPLQLEFFNDFAAGEEFYKKLKAIRESGEAEKADVLEVYFLALAHGFKGMYIDLRGMEERKTLTDQLGAEIRTLRNLQPGPLSPKAKPPDELPKLARTAPGWLVPAICFLLMIFLALGLAFTINHMGDSAADAMTTTKGEGE
jgi:type VI secretion system protein ImpK